MLSYDLNERLLSAVHSGNFEQSLSCIMQGAQASYISPTCGRTAVGVAALIGDAELLELLVQSCEEPQLDVFHQNHTDTLEMEITPDGMEKLEWVDEFEANETTLLESSADDSLYYYYAKTFENTGEFLAKGQLECCASCRQQDPHQFDADLVTPLHYAAVWGHEDCVKILLEHNAPINVVNSEGYMPLHVGAGCVEVSRLLIKHGALINAKTLSDGKTALHLAIESRSNEAVQVMLQTNVNINETDDEGETPLMMAIACSLLPLAVQLIEKDAKINLQDKQNHTALYYAVTGGHFSIAQLLLERGARRLTSQHLLHRCVRHNDRPMVELLLRHGDSLSVRDSDNHTPILVAIREQLPEMLAYLLDVLEQRRQGLYADCQEHQLLLFAVQHISDLNAFRGILRVLLAKLESARSDLYSGCEPSIVCGLFYCQTPLSRALNLQRLDIAELLIHEGCDLSQLCNNHVLSEISSCATPRRSAFARLLVEAGFKFPPKPQSALNDSPPSLQSLARLAIRQRLLEQLQLQPELQLRYLPTSQQSSLARIVQELSIPTVLKGYLSHFAELPAVRHLAEEPE